MQYRQEKPRGIGPLVLAVLVLLATAVPLSIAFVRRSGLMGMATPPMATTTIPHRVTNLRDVAFTISWTSSQAEAAYLKYGTDPKNLSLRADDERGDSFSGTTHHILVGNVAPNTTYYYDIVAGNAKDDNGGAHYVVTTGPSAGIPPPGGTVYGTVVGSDGTTPAEDIIIYVTIQDGDANGSPDRSADMSYLVRAADKGYWIFDLNNARERAGNSVGGYFRYSPTGDKLIFQAEGGAWGTTQSTVDTGTALPVPPLVLGGGTSPIPTSTPSPVTPGATPDTPIPSLTPGAPTPPATAAPTSTPSASSTAVPTPSPTAVATTHVVQPGDTLYSIARRYGVTREAIMQANGLSDPNFVWVGQALTIPGTAVPSTPTPRAAIVHIVAPGDTLYSIAVRYGVTREAIMQTNNLTDPNFIWIGQALTIPGTEPTATPIPEALLHIVAPGDTLYSIARHYGTTVSAIMQANNLTDERFIWIGQRLVIPR